MKLAVSPSKLAPLLHILVPTSIHQTKLAVTFKPLGRSYIIHNEMLVTFPTDVPRRRVDLLEINVIVAGIFFSLSFPV